MPTIWRAAAAKPDTSACQTHRIDRVYDCCAADRRQVRLLRPPGRIKSLAASITVPSTRHGWTINTAPLLPDTSEQPTPPASAEGVGVRLADDLARSGSKATHAGVPDTPQRQGLRLLRSRSPTSQAPTPFGQNQKPCRIQHGPPSARHGGTTNADPPPARRGWTINTGPLRPKA